jgi:hypothetical protein
MQLFGRIVAVMSATLDIGKARPQNHSPGSWLFAWLGYVMDQVLRPVQPKSKGRHARRRSEIRRLYAACVAQGAFRTFGIMGVSRISTKRVLFTTDPTVRDSIELFGDWRRIGLDIERAARKSKPSESTKGQLPLFD